MSIEPRPSGRVVVTGIGAITPLGTGIEKTWPRLLAGENAIDNITIMDVSDYATRFAGEVRDFNAEDWLDKKDARRIDRFISYGVAASRMALDDSGFPLNEDTAEWVGALVGSGVGGHNVLAEQARRLFEGGPSKVSPFFVPYIIPDMASGMISITLGLKGPSTCIVTACATGTDAIGDAYHIVKRGDAIAMLAGGTEAAINELGMAGFCSARAMSTRNDDPTHASRPFDNDRDGFVMGEGSGVLMLEDYDHAIARGAKIYGEVVGYGFTSDAHHITAPHPEGEGAVRAMKNSLKRAGITVEQIDYINAHGTSTGLNDKGETAAIKKVFGEQAYKVPISSTKSMIGHTLGATGALEAIFCLLAMRDSIIPPTINYEFPDPDCDLDYVPNVARKAEINYTLSNSFGFGGHNATLVLKKL
ncbi:MAG: beta-ketoacyl-ACP synthase II [Armatimonadetes bacterium]|nr:beta-ketoacyl-ACP synthase II [Armatimonadota bacterium]